ncbi:hypothetical protein WKW77_12720 [Variovorax ureilyticus]|uniref:Subtilase family protein n=1 Tax=Variovorax ureilyticus TaxID=1836198 RepID=A0ABU8VE46_9BURK
MALLHSSGLMIDAYLQWALRPAVRLFDPSISTRAVLLVEFQQDLTDSDIATLASMNLWCSNVYVGYSFATVNVPADAPKSLDNALGRLQGQGAVYCELAAPFGPESFEVFPEPEIEHDGPATVIGIIDDGCPFAHYAYRPNNGSSPSVRFIWDQGGTGPNAPMSYGTTFLEAKIKGMLAASTTPGLGVDEDHAYTLAALPSLRTMASHGGQVMSHAAGCARPIDNRPALPALVGQTGIAFVQLPPAALDDPTGLWLKHFGLDGLHAVLTYARKILSPPATRVVVNLSYGPQTGPHDGSSFVERAIEKICQKAQNYALRIVLPSGNSHLLRAHAEFNLQGLTATGHTIDWYVPADSQSYSHLEIWFPRQITLADVDIEVTSPAGVVAPPSTGVVSINTSLVPGPPGSTQLQTTIAVSPTAHASTDSMSGAVPWALATPGRWLVRVKAMPGAVNLQGIAHVYLARNDPNMGRPLRGRSGHLDSPNYGDKCGSFPSDELATNPPGMGPAEVFARGSLNGIATGACTWVAAGYRLNDGLPAPYSSGGLCRPQAPRNSPDYAFPTEQSRVLAGLLGKGNRSGINMRLSGTSIAAPQLTRQLAVSDNVVAKPAFPIRFGKGKV